MVDFVELEMENGRGERSCEVLRAELFLRLARSLFPLLHLGVEPIRVLVQKAG